MLCLVCYSLFTFHTHVHIQILTCAQEPGATVLVAGATGGVGQIVCAKLLEVREKGPSFIRLSCCMCCSTNILAWARM